MFANRRDAVAAVVFALLAMGSTALAVEPMDVVRLKINFALAAALGGNPFGGSGVVVIPVNAEARRIEIRPPLDFRRPPIWLVPDPPPESLPTAVLPVPVPPKKQAAGSGRRKIK